MQTEIIAGLIALVLFFLGWKYRENEKAEKKINTAKIPDQVLRWKNKVVDASSDFNVPYSIAHAVLWVESAGNPYAVGSADERGLMQLKEIAVKDLKLFGYGEFPNWQTDPRQNIRAGVAFLALQKKRTGNWYEAVKAYNQGFAGKDRYPQRANEYLEKVKQKEKFFS